MDKKATRMRRAKKTRAKIFELGETRLTVHRTPSHIYAQVISPMRDRVIAAASSLDAEVKAKITKGRGGNVAAAKMVGTLIASRAQAAGVKKVAFDRSGFRYHGRIQALADAAREAGIEF